MKSTSNIIAGMGTALRLIQLLLDDIRRKGGFEEVLHFLTTERGKENLSKVVDLIISQDWVVPRSLMESLSVQYWADHGTTDDDGEISRFYWSVACEKVGLLLEGFANPSYSEDYRPIPPEISKQLLGKPITYPLKVTHEGEEYLVCHVDNVKMIPGKPFECYDGDRLYIGLLPSRLIDWDR